MASLRVRIFPEITRKFCSFLLSASSRVPPLAEEWIFVEELVADGPCSEHTDDQLVLFHPNLKATRHSPDSEASTDSCGAVSDVSASDYGEEEEEKEESKLKEEEEKEESKLKSDSSGTGVAEDASQLSCLPLSPLLHAKLCFYEPGNEASSPEQRPILRVDRAEDGKRPRVIGLRPSDGTEAGAPLEDLRVDTRALPDDEPKIIALIGARTRRGKVARVFVPSGCGIAVCELSRDGEAPCVPLDEVVEELCDLERQRRNSELVQYQRRLCSSMMGAQRRRLLGLSG